MAEGAGGLNMDPYSEAIRRMEFWRHVEKYVLWAGLGWPLAFFVMPVHVALLIWLGMLIMGIYAHYTRLRHNRTASQHYNENDETDGDNNGTAL